MSVYVVSHFTPADIGHGGLHRSFQLDHDARALVDTGDYTFVSLKAWRSTHKRAEKGAAKKLSGRGRRLRALRKTFRGLAARMTPLLENPFNMLGSDRYPTAIPFSTTGWVEQEFVAHYSAIVSKGQGPRICIVEHPVFGEIVDLNTRLGIPTLAAFHNLEALDASPFNWRSRADVYRIMTDLGNELRLLGRCAARLFISKVEVGFVGGLGLTSAYYPYLPVGAIRKRLTATRRRRLAGVPEAGPILLLGSAKHGVTGDAMRWFVEQAAQHGLPAGVRVIAVGAGTDRLLGEGALVPGFEARGWVDQAELDDLLATAAAAIVPHHLGFGALTRLPELACAGVPAITFNHACLALDPAPGLRTVVQEWAAISSGLQESLAQPVVVGDRDYECWEAAQPRPLADVVRRLAVGQ